MILLLFALATAPSLISPSSAQCSSFTFSENRVYGLCSSLPRLGSSLHWTYHPSNITVDLAFRSPISSPAWVAWGINPSAPRMNGTQALVAVVSSSGNVTAYPSPITSYSPSLQRGNLSINVFHIAATYAGGIITIFATISLPNNSTVVNHVWQSSATLAGDVPAGHPTSGDNVLSLGSLNFLYGEYVAQKSYVHLKNVHGILCTVGWGLLAPLAITLTRYSQPTTAPWIRFQTAIYWSAYVIGVVGWGVGLAVGNESIGVEYLTHRAIGIAIFCIATIIYVSGCSLHLNLTPGGYFDLIGLSLVILSIVNIFKGFYILDVAKSWRAAYIAFVTIIGTVYFIPLILMAAYYLKNVSF